MKLSVYNMVTREEIPLPAQAQGDWAAVSAGKTDFLAFSRGGSAVLFHVDEYGETVTAEPIPEDWRNLTGTAVSSVYDKAYAAWDIFGNLRLITPQETSVRRFPKGIRQAVLGSLLAVLTPEGRVYTRRYCSSYGTAWQDTGWEHVTAISSGPCRLCGLGEDGTVRLLEVEQDLRGDVTERRLGRAQAVADGTGGVWTLRDGKLCCNGRVFPTGGDIAALSVGISQRLEYLLCRRADGSFLQAMTGNTYSPSTFPMEHAAGVRAWALGDCFAVCLM